MMLPWLNKDSLDFPPTEQATEDGLLAVGGDLHPARILAAYRQGIFPWFSDGQPPLWWSPNPRMVLFPDEFRLHRSLRKRLQKADFEIRFDSAFEHVIDACAQTPRAGQRGTWITAEMRAAYCALHQQGIAHSSETWIDGKLVGGLYGLAIGRVFYGESMFSHKTDASKMAFASLVDFLRAQNFALIDCQVYTPHLASLGAREIPRQAFLRHITELTQQASLLPQGEWTPIRL